MTTFPLLDLSWLSDALKGPPLVPESNARLTTFEILGLVHSEKAYSDYLAYLFDKEADHGLGTLCLEALLQTALPGDEHAAARQQWLQRIDESPYRVLRERHYIDLLIQSTDQGATEDSFDVDQGEESEPEEATTWAIIIENKIGSHLHNPLHTYWDAVQADEKIGLVLAPPDTTQAITQRLAEIEKHTDRARTDLQYYAAKYNHLKENILQALSAQILDLEARSIFLLQDFLPNLTLIYPPTTNLSDMNEALKNIHDHRLKIQELNKRIKDLQALVVKDITRRMRELGYSPKQSNRKRSAPDTDHFFPMEPNNQLPLRFWVNFSSLTVHGYLRITLELHGPDVKYRDALVEKLTDMRTFSETGIKEANRATKSYAHLFYLDQKVSAPDVSTCLDQEFSKIERFIRDTHTALRTILGEKGRDA